MIMKRWVRIFAFGCAALLSPPASAETYPSRPITIVIGFAPGSGIDVIHRVIAQPAGNRA
jgi:tripartite-type tricarboxylate transporter receptor subunit TctC